jgi:hypothetical protein
MGKPGIRQECGNILLLNGAGIANLNIKDPPACVLVTNNTSFDIVKAIAVNGQIEILCQNRKSTDSISWMVIWQ